MSREVGWMKSRKRNIIGMLVLALLLAAAGSLCVGLVPLSPLKALTGTLSPVEQKVLWLLRLPRLLMSLGAGAALALSGTVLQGVFGNPLVDPGILGVSGGAALGAVIVLCLGLAQQAYFWLPAGGFLGAAAVSLFVQLLGHSQGLDSRTRLLLSGVTVSLFTGALTTALLSVAPDAVMRQYFFWTLGSLASVTWQQVEVLLPPIVLVSIALPLMGRQLNVLSLGEEQALAVGLEAGLWRRLLLLLTSFLMALAVCGAGTIGFVGLCVPHMLRLLLGPDHRLLLPVSTLGGAVFLTLCDCLGRLLVPGSEIRVGIITALFGAPYFLYLLRKRR